MNEENDESRTQINSKFMKIIRIINIIVAIMIILFSLLSFIFMVIQAITSFRIFLLFSPIFMTLFGLTLLAAQCKIKFVMNRLPFLNSMLARGILNLYLSSIMYYFFYVLNDTVLAWVSALSLFITGLVYIVIHMGWMRKMNLAGLEEEKDSQKENIEINL